MSLVYQYYFFGHSVLETRIYRWSGTSGEDLSAATKSAVPTSIQCSIVTMGLSCSVFKIWPWTDGGWITDQCWQALHIWALMQPSSNVVGWHMKLKYIQYMICRLITNYDPWSQPWSLLTIILIWCSFIIIITRGQSNLTKSASQGAHSPVRGHPRGLKFVPLNSWARVSY